MTFPIEPRDSVAVVDAPIISTISTQKARRVLRLALEYAVLAPSSHNTQPWLFRLDDNTVELYADTERVLKTVDPNGRELIMSCGAALYILRLALRSFGYTEKTELFPNPDNKHLLARVTLTGIGHPNKEDKRLFEAVPDRHTNRKPFEVKAINAALVNELELAAGLEGARLYLTQDETIRQNIAEMVADGDIKQWVNPGFRHELAAWTHSNHSKKADGIPGYALNIGDIPSQLTPVIIRHFDRGQPQATKDHKLIEGAPAIAVLYTTTDTARDWLLAGQALSHVLLKARVHNVHASFFNQPIEIEDLREGLKERLELLGYPQLMFRLGYADEVKATPRREIDDVMIV
jgi:nitroreductase